MKKITFLTIALLIGFAGCGRNIPFFDPAPEINHKARDEAAKAVDEAEKAFNDADAQVDAILAIPATGDQLAFVKSRKPQFESAGAQYQIAKDKFTVAAAKFDEAMNDKKYWDSALHCKFKLLGEAYKEWAELANVQVRLTQEAINIKDVKSFISKTNELDAESKRLNAVVDQKIKSARSCGSADVKN